MNVTINGVGGRMLENRREFLRSMGGIAVQTAFLSTITPEILHAVERGSAGAGRFGPDQFASDEEFWHVVRSAFTMAPGFLNLENGYMSPAPAGVLDAQMERLRAINARPSPYMRNDQGADRDRAKKALAALAGCRVDELVITRNTTESLDTIISGLDLRAGDEVIVTDQDYGSMLEAFRQQSKRFGIVLRTVSVPLHPVSDDEIVRVFTAAITSRTKVMLVTHMINITGQILPVRTICDAAHERGVEVIVDAAHSLAHIEFSIADLHCDYLGSSLHKWLCAPLGTGLLYIRKEKIVKVWPLLGDDSFPADDIRKFEHLGTRPVSSEAGIVDAIRFHNAIGGKRKEARLRYLMNYWAERIVGLPGVYLNTPLAPERSCGIGNFGVEGKTSAQIVDYLFNQHKIFTVPIDTGPVHGVRVTPHLYTSAADLDLFVDAVRQFTRS
jgi:selenocysteine lyase/cysteine desulfurase